MKTRITIEKALELMRDCVDAQLTESKLTDEEYGSQLYLIGYLETYLTDKDKLVEDEVEYTESGEQLDLEQEIR